MTVSTLSGYALVVTWNRTALRGGVVSKVDHHLVDKAPSPTFRRVVTLDDGVLRCVEMLGRVAVRRLVATTNVTAGSAEPKVKPCFTALQAFLAPQCAWGD